MTRAPFMRWFGWSVAAHVALGIALWLGLPHVDPTSLVESDAAVTLVSLVEAPAHKHHATKPHASSPPPPLKKGGGGDLPLGPTSRQPMDIMDESVVNHRSDPSPSAPETAQPESTTDPVNDVPDLPNSAMHSLPPSPVSVDVPEASPSAGRSTDQYRPRVLAILERAKRYPLMAQHRGIEGTVEVAFLINPDGRLSDPELIASSNHRMLDEATLTMLRRVGVLPPPPDRETIRFPARIQYQIAP